MVVATFAVGCIFGDWGLEMAGMGLCGTSAFSG